MLMEVVIAKQGLIFPNAQRMQPLAGGVFFGNKLLTLVYFTFLIQKVVTLVINNYLL